MNFDTMIPKELVGYVYFSSPGVLCAKGKLPSSLVEIFKQTKEKIYNEFNIQNKRK